MPSSYPGAVFRTQGGGVVFVGFGTGSPEVYQQAVTQVASSFVPTEIIVIAVQPQEYVSPPTSQPGQPLPQGSTRQNPASLSPMALQWDQHLRGMKVSYRDSYSSNTLGGGGISTVIDYYLCRDGRFMMQDGSSVSSGSSSDFSFTEGGDLGSSNQGRWEIVTEGNLVGIKLTWSNGQVDLARLEFYDGGTYVNGDRYYVTQDNPYC